MTEYKPWYEGIKFQDSEHPVVAELTYKFFAGEGWIVCSNCNQEFSYEMWKEDPDSCIKLHYTIHEMNKNAKN